MTVSLKVLLHTLPTLNASELEQVRLRVAALTSGAKEATPTQADWLLEGLVLSLSKRGLLGSGFRVPRALDENYRKHGAALRDFLLQGMPDTLRTIERVSIAQIVGECLIDYLKRIRVPLSPNAVGVNLDKIPTALDEAFPGYWAAGALSVLGGMNGRDASSVAARGRSGRSSVQRKA